MQGTPGPQTIESIVAFWICIPLAVIFGLLVVVAIVAMIKDFEWFLVGSALVFALIAGGFYGGYVWGMYPDDFEHHHYTRYTGTVATTNSRLLSDGDHGTDQKFVVTFAESPDEPFGVLDTRAATVRAGDRLTIDCVTRWQQAGSEGKDCEYVRKVSK